MSPYKSQRPAVRSRVCSFPLSSYNTYETNDIQTQKMKEQIASMRKHILFIEEQVAVKDDPKTSQDIQAELHCATKDGHVYHSAVQLIPVSRAVDNGYEFQFVKPADVPGLSHDGWEVWTPQTTSDETSDEISHEIADEISDETSDDAHEMTVQACSCQPTPYRIRYGDVTYLRPENCLIGWGDWDRYSPGQIVEWHEDSKDWHAPIKSPFSTGSAVNLFKLLNEQSRGKLTLREAVDFYREHVVQEDFKEFEECHFCAGDRVGFEKVLFRV